MHASLLAHETPFLLERPHPPLPSPLLEPPPCLIVHRSVIGSYIREIRDNRRRRTYHRRALVAFCSAPRAEDRCRKRASRPRDVCIEIHDCLAAVYRLVDSTIARALSDCEIFFRIDESKNTASASRRLVLFFQSQL